MKRTLIPLALFVVLAIFLGLGLKLDPREVPSPLVGKLAPPFSLPQLEVAVNPSTQAASGAAPSELKFFNPLEMQGKVWLLNVWASWCVSCLQEHPVLLDFAKTNLVPLVGLNYKDQWADALGWLAQHGNPYTLSAFDADGHTGINYGVYGVPETYVIDKTGVIRFKQIGPITLQVLQSKLLPLIKELQR
jgi:cytochrome c biogenesis protein CcmG, thiol:disulfide interchange protein DsbE